MKKLQHSTHPNLADEIVHLAADVRQRVRLNITADFSH
jgi:hypothetical protein